MGHIKYQQRKQETLAKTERVTYLSEWLGRNFYARSFDFPCQLGVSAHSHLNGIPFYFPLFGNGQEPKLLSPLPRRREILKKVCFCQLDGIGLSHNAKQGEQTQEEKRPKKGNGSGQSYFLLFFVFLGGQRRRFEGRPPPSQIEGEKEGLCGGGGGEERYGVI